MLNLSENSLVITIILIGLIIIIWGYNRAKNYDEIAILAWLQSLSLMAPWFVFFLLFALGSYLNLIGVIFLLVLSASFYIYLGNKIRNKSQEKISQSQKKKELDTFATPEMLSQLDLDLAKNRQQEEKQLEPHKLEDKKSESLTPPITSTKSQIEPDFMPMEEQELNQIKDIFTIDTFFATETIPYQEGVIFKGNLRGESDFTHGELSKKLTAKMGDKYRLFLVETPEGKPVVIILPQKNDPQPLTLAQKNLALALFFVTIFTSLEAISLLLGFDLFSDWSRYQEALPLTLGLWLILLVHEMGHQLMGKKHQVKISLPFFLPNIQIGSFGAITRFESIIPNRSVLFDISFAGPAAGGLLSLLFLLLGLTLSHNNSTFAIPSQFFQSSILVATLAKIFLGTTLANSTTSVHPLTVLGWLGLVITAINLLPAGQLDGGRIIQAIYGRKTARRSTILTLIILGIVSLFNPINSLPFYWAIIILFLQRDLERPSLNELTEPDDTRAGWALLLILLALATLIPVTPSLAIRLGIGI
jgi:membrane-associated protease RseP (regulator of RpoE activity)